MFNRGARLYTIVNETSVAISGRDFFPFQDRMSLRAKNDIFVDSAYAKK
jgi:hypothetical protein